MYDDFDLTLLRKDPAEPEPEENIRRANAIIPLINQRRFKDAEALLQAVTSPSIREDLTQRLEFDRTCWCIQE